MLRFLVIACLLLSGAAAAHADETRKATLYKDPHCTCCQAYADHLSANGFEVDVRPTDDVVGIASKGGIPEAFQGCHTTFIDGYAVGGHVPLGTLERLLSERPEIAGISLPGMPLGSPGMGGEKEEPFTIYAIPKSGTAPTVYATE